VSAEVVSIAERRTPGVDAQPLDPHRQRERETYRRLNMVARRLAALDERQVKVVFDVLGKALDWYDAKGAVE
jgi:hypothetical protein